MISGPKAGFFGVPSGTGHALDLPAIRYDLSKYKKVFLRGVSSGR